MITLTDSKYKIEIPEDVYKKIRHWMDKSNQEVSGLGSVEYDEEEKVFTVVDAILLEQKVTPTSAEISPNAINKAMFEMKDIPNALKWHWHSHVDMGVFWSADDKSLIEELGSQGWIVATVFNKKDEMRSALCSPVAFFDEHSLIFADELETSIITYEDARKTALWDKEYNEKVSEEKKYAPPTREGAEIWSAKQKKFISYEDYCAESEDEEVRETELDLFEHQQSETGGRKFKLWNRFGYTNSEPFFYNPIYDSTLSTRFERLSEIDEMTDVDIQYALKHCPTFKVLFDDYVNKEVTQ